MFLNLLNQKFNKLTVIEYVGKRGKFPHHYWKCKCECGKESIVQSSHIRTGHIKSCGSCILRLTHEEFIKRLDEKYPNRTYSIESKYFDMNTKLLLRNNYGDCLMLPEKLLNGKLPTIYSAIDKTSYWINQAKEIHDFKYDYSLVQYVDYKTKVKIICPYHEIFEQKPSTHIVRTRKSSGCPECGLENRGFTKNNFLNAAKK